MSTTVCVFVENKNNIYLDILYLLAALVAQLDVRPTGDQVVVGLTSAWLATFLHED